MSAPWTQMSAYSHKTICNLHYSAHPTVPSHLLPHLTVAQGPILSPICIPRTSSRESMFVKCMNWASSTLFRLLTRIWLLLNLSWEKNTELKYTVYLLCHWSRVGDTGDSISKQDIHKQRYTWSRNEKLKPGAKSHFPQQPAACWDPRLMGNRPRLWAVPSTFLSRFSPRSKPSGPLGISDAGYQPLPVPSTPPRG